MTDFITPAIPDGMDVAKANIRGWANNRVAQRTTLTELRSGDFTALQLVVIGSATYARVPSDTTSLDDGNNVVVDGGGNRWVKQATTISAVNFRGGYLAGTTYAKGDAVTSNGQLWAYWNKTPGAGNAPPTPPTETNSYWQLASSDGPAGADGATVAQVLTALGIPSITVSTSDPSGPASENAIWLKVPA